MSRILLVDDEQNVLDGMRRMLHSQGFSHECVGVTSAQQALDALSTGDFEVVVSDVRMPGMDGVELLARIKGTESLQHIPVIMLTGYSDADAKRTAIHLGCYDFVSKPADASELIARLENAMRMKRYEDALREQNSIMERQLLQAQKMEIVGLLASGLVHDLNNILASIVGYTELASRWAKNSPELQTHLNHAAESGEHATKLVRQILNLGRRVTSDDLTTDLSCEVEDGLRLLHATMGPGIKIVWSKPQAPLVARIDSTQLHQILMNLCTNAAHAMKGNGTLTIELEPVEFDAIAAADHSLECAGPYAQLTVHDTGHGMDESVLQQLFDPFFTTKPKGEGTGIGLSVVRRIVDNHNGSIHVTSTPGSGTTFTILMPLVSVDNVQSRATGLEGAHARTETSTIR